MRATDNVDLAKFIHAPPRGAPVEASMRCACGRAYYAAHVIARDLLRAKFAVSRDGRAHREVIDLLKRSKNLDVRQAGLSLDRLKDTRNSADYDVGSITVRGLPFDKNRAAFAILQAQTIISMLESTAKTDRRLGIP